MIVARRAASAAVLLLAPAVALAQTVRVTPLGSKAEEFCAGDRALLFEDPTGVRILYDAGRTIRRLGDVHAILLSHVHVDHFDNAELAQDPDASSASCSGHFATIATPQSTTRGARGGEELGRDRPRGREHVPRLEERAPPQPAHS